NDQTRERSGEPRSLTALRELLDTSQGIREITAETAVIGAHPDDEAVGLGGRLPLFRNAWFIRTTDGAPLDGRDVAINGFATREEYRDTRTREMAAALGAAGIPSDRSMNLGCIDQP